MSDLTRSNMRRRELLGRSRVKSLAGAIFVTVVGAIGSVEASDIGGDWARGDGNARVQISPCGAGIYALNTWVTPGTPHEKAGEQTRDVDQRGRR